MAKELGTPEAVQMICCMDKEYMTGFRYQWTTKDVDVPLMHEKRTGHVNLMTRATWLQQEEADN